ncbi:MAG: hypothetical protein COB66_03495 [Coxiella sp. (in: Bacteria)]|nr:MAG: hypothetical protein COB66_03495 [Coxiella sp. (in: g-proteobacteria)]
MSAGSVVMYVKRARKTKVAHRKLVIAFLANFFIPLAGISTDIYLPSLPALSAHYATSHAMVQYTVVTFTLGMGLMQFIAGPVSDALGRRKLLLAALIVQFITIVLILVIPSITWMILLRFIQGAAAAFMIVPARALLNDVFSADQLKKQFNYTTISFALGPILGPFIGSYLQLYFGWHANFIFILGYAFLALMFVLFLLPETIASTHRFSMSHLWKNYGCIIQNKAFVVTCALTACMPAANMLFTVAGSFIIQKSLHYSVIMYGRMSLVIGFAWFLGNLLNRLLFSIPEKIKVRVGLSIAVVTAIIMLLFSIAGYFTLILFVIPTFIMVVVGGGLFSLFVSNSLSKFSDLAASANGFLFSITWIGFSVFTLIASTISTTSLISLSSVLVAAYLLSMLLALLRRHVH